MEGLSAEQAGTLIYAVEAWTGRLDEDMGSLLHRDSTLMWFSDPVQGPSESVAHRIHIEPCTGRSYFGCRHRCCHRVGVEDLGVHYRTMDGGRVRDVSVLIAAKATLSEPGRARRRSLGQG